MNLCGWDGIPSQKRIPVTCFVLCWIAASHASDTDSAIGGFEAAKTKCARCHVIGEYNRMGGIGNAPRFSPWHNMKTYGNVFLRFTRDARTRSLSGSLDMPSGQMRFLNIRNSRFLRRKSMHCLPMPKVCGFLKNGFSILQSLLKGVWLPQTTAFRTQHDNG